jgi:transposase
VSLTPLGTSKWFKPRSAKSPQLQGVRHFLGFYDVHRDCLGGVFRRRKRIADVLEAFRRLRRCYPRRRLIVVMDNLHNVHDHPRFLRGLAHLRITPVFTATDASWMNLIEAQFGVLKRFTLTDTDDPSHGVRQRRIRHFLRYRHRQRGLTGHPLTRLHLLRPIKLEEH